MLDAVHAFFDELRTSVSVAWPKVQHLPPAWAAEVRVDHVIHRRATNEGLDRIEATLASLCEEGAESAAARALFDQTLAIIEETSMPGSERLKQIGEVLKDAGRHPERD
jgi:hypothetical protein